MAFFKFRKDSDDHPAPAPAPESVETMRRRARRIQDLMQTIGPLGGLIATAVGTIYTGLKGVFGP